MIHGKRIIQDGKLYLTRYYLKGNGKGKSWELYLHHIHTPDPDRAPHNHPWPWFLSIILKGWYVEGRMDLQARKGSGGVRRWFNLVRSRGVFHRIVEIAPGGVWTLVLVAPRQGQWGYAKGGTFIPYNEHHDDYKAWAEEF